MGKEALLPLCARTIRFKLINRLGDAQPVKL